MSATDLQTPIIEGAIRSTNFFNGRLLSARDLTLEQSAYREADRRLGKAIGEGIAYGLEVTKPTSFKKDSPSITVDAGLAINRQGQTLMLRARTEVALVRSSTTVGTSKSFSECLPLQTGAYVAGAGVYLLTIAPAQTSEGRAVTSAINPATTTCNTDTVVSAVQFRLIQIDSALSPLELQDQNHLRNLVAYKTFGVNEQAAFVKDVFGGQWKKYGLVDGLRPNQLTDCEVPLAILSWTDQDGVKFVDNWSVRRRLVRYLVAGHDPAAADETSPTSSDAMVFASRTAPYVDERRAAEGLAMLLQFQEQLFAIANSVAQPQNFAATDAFRWLPPAGLLPLSSVNHPSGFSYEKFFASKPFAPPALIDGAKLGALLSDSLHYSPIDLNGNEHLQLYTVTENTLLSGQSLPQPYIVFASEKLPYYSDKPRFEKLCQVLREAATVYLNIHKKGQLYSSQSTGTALTARLAVISAVEFVIQTAGAQSVAACGSGYGLSYERALDTLSLMYTAQAQLVTAVLADAAHVPTGATEFANALHEHLDISIPAAPSNKPSLAAALAAKNLNAAIEAQDIINAIATGEVIITDIPLTPPPRVNQTLDIFGQNFGFKIGAQQVTFDGDIVVGAYLPGSNDQHLIIKVPVIPNLPPQGRPVLVEVRNLTSSDSRTIPILPVVQIIEGPVDVSFVSVDPTTIPVDAPATFKYHVKSRASIQGIYTVTPEIKNMTDNANVQNALQVLDANGIVLSAKQISLAPNQEKDFFVKIPKVPAGSSGVLFNLKVTVATEGSSGFDGPRDFTVGQIVIPPDPMIVFTFLEPKLVMSPAGGSLDKTTNPFTIKLVTNTGSNNPFARVSIQAALKTVDTYTASTSIISGTGWNTTVNTQLVPNPFEIKESDFPAGAQEVTKELRYLISPSVGASNKATVELKLKRAGTTQFQTMRLDFQLI